MTRSRARTSALVLMLVAGLFAAVSMLFAGAASAQEVACPAGARGGNGGDAGRSTGGAGGLGFTVGGLGFATTGNVDAAGGTGGSARGGTGGRGGTGTLPVCNQNTNGAVARPAAGGGGGAAGGGHAYGAGGGLARTGARSYAEIGIAGLAFVAGGLFLFMGQPRRSES
jgi:hypothetical protein